MRPASSSAAPNGPSWSGFPGWTWSLKGRLDIPSTGVKSFRFTLDELARICLALSEALLDVEGRDVVKLLAVAGKVTDLLNQAVGELERPFEGQESGP